MGGELLGSCKLFQARDQECDIYGEGSRILFLLPMQKLTGNKLQKKEKVDVTQDSKCCLGKSEK